MSSLIDRLQEPIITQAYEARHLTRGVLAERLIRERLDAADMIQKLRAVLQAIGDWELHRGETVSAGWDDVCGDPGAYARLLQR